MGFKENLHQKITIDHLADQVVLSWGTPEAPGRIDRQAMRTLLAMGPYTHRQERDLELYCQEVGDGPPRVIVLDNELKLYRTTVEDVVLRKSPTLKEMVNIRNAIKILNDKAVVECAKYETVARLRQELIAALDLTHTPADIQALAQDGQKAMENRYSDGVIDVLTLFAELLGYVKAPKLFEVAHCRIWGILTQDSVGAQRFGPLVIFNQLDNRLKMIRESISTKDREAVARVAQTAKGERKAELENLSVLSALVEAVESS